MTNDLISIVSKSDSLSEKDLVSLSLGKNKKTGERYLKAKDSDGVTYIGKITASGIKEKRLISIPPFSSKKERDNYIKELYAKDYTQNDVAEILDISQSTVSNVLSKK